jgi:hypothetical protein
MAAHRRRQLLCIALHAASASACVARDVPTLRLLYTPQALVFGEVEAGTSKQLTVDVLNGGEADVEIGQVKSDDDAIVVGSNDEECDIDCTQPLPAVIAVSEHATLAVRCEPSSPATIQAVVTINVWERDVDDGRYDMPFPASCVGVDAGDGGLVVGDD